MSNPLIEKLQQWMKDNAIDVTYIHHPSSIAYFTSYESDPHERILALFIPAEGEPFLFTPALEVEDAENSNWPYAVHGYLDSENPWQKIADYIRKFPAYRQFAIEKNSLPVERFEALQTQFPDAHFDFDVTPFIQQSQLYKSEEEKQFMMEAGDWADVAFEVGFKAIKEGVSEQEIVAQIEFELKKRGVSHMSFDTLVLADAHAASPHGTPTTTNKIHEHELVLFDLGCMWKGYASDATRMASYKEPTDLQRKIFDIVFEAQKRAQEAAKPGMTAGELDAVARDYITKKGYGEYFTHRLGHGIGKSCHEFPSIVGGSDVVLEEGMCFSIEPGIYIPNEVGVRVEDCGYLTKDGFEAFTKTPKELYIIQ